MQDSMFMVCVITNGKQIIKNNYFSLSLETVGTSSIPSRASAVLSNGKYIFALPGSSGGVTDAWDKILVHQLDINHKPCNFVELLPRLKEK